MVQKIISTAEIKEEELIEEGIDFIVSTAKLNLTFPNVYVNSILTETDKKMINAMIKNIDKKKRKNPIKTVKPVKRIGREDIEYMTLLGQEILQVLDNIKIIRHGGGYIHRDGYCWYENQPNDKYKVWNNQVNTTGTPLTLDKPTLNITSDDNYSYEYHTVLLNEDNTVYNDNYTDNYKFRFGFVAGNSEFRGQQTIQCYVGTQGGKADDGKTSIGEIKYTKLNKIGELTIYSPIES